MAHESDLYWRAERVRQVGTPEQRRAREHEAARRFAERHGGGECAKQQPACLGGEYCVHALYDALAPDAMRAATRYDYGTDARQRRTLHDRLMRTFVTRRVPLAVAGASGVGAPLLLFAGVDVRALLVHGYVLETLIEQLALDWRTTLALGASRDDERLFPPHVLRDAFGDAVNSF